MLKTGLSENAMRRTQASKWFPESNIVKIHFKAVGIWVIPPHTAQKKCEEVHEIIIDDCQSSILKTAGTSPAEEVGKF
jgi:hypothetical protein